MPALLLIDAVTIHWMRTMSMLCLLGAACAAQKLNADTTFDRWLDVSCAPSKDRDARWQQPSPGAPRWVRSVAARPVPAGQRPVLLWAMNGHPLACV